jgi:hypothetical protein
MCVVQRGAVLRVLPPNTFDQPIDDNRSLAQSLQIAATALLCYTAAMTRLMEIIINRLRQVPEGNQDQVASVVANLLEEFPTPQDHTAIAEGRAAYERGEYIALDQLEHDGIWY